jgi:hypothetical protein
MHELIEFIKDSNLPTLLAIIGASWCFTRDIKKEIKEIRQEIQGIHKDFKFYNTRLSRTEGTVYGKEIYTPEID